MHVSPLSAHVWDALGGGAVGDLDISTAVELPMASANSNKGVPARRASREGSMPTEYTDVRSDARMLEAHDVLRGWCDRLVYCWPWRYNREMRNE